jgi:hypothetical protein
LGSLLANDEGKAKHTGSVESAGGRASNRVLEGDLADARAAVAAALAKAGAQGAPKSAPWENPRTGARGTVIPLAAAHRREGVLCRDFLASYVQEESESWLEGEACRVRRRWEVRTLRPWKRT